ncbi:MAG TPA: DUF167 family protein [Ktedonobacterales bacterium]
MEPPCASALREAADGVSLTVRVMPRASRAALACEQGTLRARVLAPPVDGAANEAVIALLAERLRVPRRDITLRQGAAARLKVFTVTGLTRAEALRRLAGP